MDQDSSSPTINRVVLTSNAKLNIGLRILGRRPEDGYHLLETIFQEIDLADEIQIEELKQRGIFHERFTLTCADPNIPLDDSNLIMKAIWAMIPYLPIDLGAKIHLVKRIPTGAGLGGGSSNAAALLKWLNLKAKLCENDLAEIALNLGADVPFFLNGGTICNWNRGKIDSDRHSKRLVCGPGFPRSAYIYALGL